MAAISHILRFTDILRRLGQKDTCFLTMRDVTLTQAAGCVLRDVLASILHILLESSTRGQMTALKMDRVAGL